MKVAGRRAAGWEVPNVSRRPPPALRLVSPALVLLFVVGVAHGRVLRGHVITHVELDEARSVKSAIVNASHLAFIALGRQTALEPGSHGLQASLRLASASIDAGEALRRLQQLHHVPGDVASLLRFAALGGDKASGGSGGFSDEAMQKARVYLNGLMEQAWDELDHIILECKDFEDSSRASMEQASQDLAALGEDVADVMRMKIEANEGLNILQGEIRRIEERMKAEDQNFHEEKAELQQKLKEHQTSASAFWMLLKESNCSAPSGFLLQRGSASGRRGRHRRAPRLGVCVPPGAVESVAPGEFRICHLPVLHRHKRAGRGLLQGGARARNVTNVTMQVASTTWLPPVAPIANDAPCPCRSLSGFGGACSVMQKGLAMEWSAALDAAADAEEALAQQEEGWSRLHEQLNMQLDTLVTTKAGYASQLDESISKLNLLQEHQKQKEDELRHLRESFQTEMSQCHTKVERILHEDVCSLMTVRSAVLAASPTTPGKDIIDCEVTDWVADACTMACDDTCGGTAPCGGKQVLTRTIVTKGQWGRSCPSLTRERRCNQIKCPVDCVLSEWSGFSACTKECESGVQGRTRSVLTKPKYGGLVCDTVQQERPCNTQSCDEDCTLNDWTRWSGCSSACGGGVNERRRQVLVPIKGEGRCPAEDSQERLQREDCNTHECFWDSVCSDIEDMVVLVDGSGCATVEEFTVLKKFIEKLVHVFKAEFYGREAMRVGVVQYGNGVVLADGTVSMANVILPLAAHTDIDGKVVPAIDAMQPSTGFSNLPQALVVAKRMLESSGRPYGAANAILVVTNGAPMFLHQTRGQLAEFEDAHILKYFVPVIEMGDQHIQQFAEWATAPSQAHSATVPGIGALQQDMDGWVTKVIAKTCAMVTSQMLRRMEAASTGYTLVAPSSICANPEQLQRLSTTADLEQCASLAADAGAMMFYSGRPGIRKGYCYADTPFASARTTMPASGACSTFLDTTGCLSTLDKSCPGQRLGKNGVASDDGSQAYECCCKQNLWQSMCTKFMGSDGCAWTKDKSCPGQPAGSGGTATDDGSNKYKCCCTLGLWQNTTELWNSWLADTRGFGCPAPMTTAAIAPNGMFDVYGVRPDG